MDKNALRDINIENLKKNPILVNLKTSSNSKEYVNPNILEKLRSMSLANSINNNCDKKIIKKVNFIKSKKRDNNVEVSNKNGLANIAFKENDIELISGRKGLVYIFNLRGG